MDKQVPWKVTSSSKKKVELVEQEQNGYIAQLRARTDTVNC